MEGECPVQADAHADPFGAVRPVDARAQRRLAAAVAICGACALVEVAGGLAAGSLAVLSDAAHLLADVGGFAVSLAALRLAAIRPTLRLSYGYRRAEPLGALVSLSLVWAATAFLVFEAIERLRHPQEIDGRAMAAVAAFGVGANVSLALVLHERSHSHGSESLLEAGGACVHAPHVRNIGVRAALVHALGDLVQSVGVLLAAVLVWLFPAWRAADALCTFLCAFLVLLTTVSVAHDALLVLMEAAPAHVAPGDVLRALAAVRGVVDAHDLHVWALSPDTVAASVHVRVDLARRRDAAGCDWSARESRETHRNAAADPNRNTSGTGWLLLDDSESMSENVRAASSKTSESTAVSAQQLSGHSDQTTSFASLSVNEVLHAHSAVLAECHRALCRHGIHHAAVQLDPLVRLSHCRTTCGASSP